MKNYILLYNDKNILWVKNMLDFRVYTFLEVCREMNYTRAASELNITQPNVTQHIRYLENCFGQKLFRMNGKKLVLTQAGELLKEVATAMCREEQALKSKMMDSREQNLSFGITKSINESSLKKSVVSFLKKYADRHVRFCVNNTEHLLWEMENLEMGFAIVEGNYDREKFDSVILSRENFIAVRGKDYPLKAFHGNMRDLLGECLILREQGSGTREILESMLHVRNIGLKNFESVAEIGEVAAIKELVKEGCGITFLYETAARKELESGELVRIPLEDFTLEHEFAFIWPRTAFDGEFFRQIANRFFLNRG